MENSNGQKTNAPFLWTAANDRIDGTSKRLESKRFLRAFVRPSEAGRPKRGRCPFLMSRVIGNNDLSLDGSSWRVVAVKVTGPLFSLWLMVVSLQRDTFRAG